MLIPIRFAQISRSRAHDTVYIIGVQRQATEVMVTSEEFDTFALALKNCIKIGFGIYRYCLFSRARVFDRSWWPLSTALF